MYDPARTLLAGLGILILLLGMASPGPAHAVPMSFNFTYSPFKPLNQDHVSLDITGYLDDSQIPASGTALVVLDHLEMTFTA